MSQNRDVITTFGWYDEEGRSLPPKAFDLVVDDLVELPAECAEVLDRLDSTYYVACYRPVAGSADEKRPGLETLFKGRLTPVLQIPGFGSESGYLNVAWLSPDHRSLLLQVRQGGRCEVLWSSPAGTAPIHVSRYVTSRTGTSAAIGWASDGSALIQSPGPNECVPGDEPIAGAIWSVGLDGSKRKIYELPQQVGVGLWRDLPD